MYGTVHPFHKHSVNSTLVLQAGDYISPTPTLLTRDPLGSLPPALVGRHCHSSRAYSHHHRRSHYLSASHAGASCAGCASDRKPLFPALALAHYRHDHQRVDLNPSQAPRQV